MGLFKEVEGEVAILVEGGVYKQAPLYTRNGYLYAKSNGGFVRLNADGSTTKAKCLLETLTWEGRLAADKIGRLCDPSQVRDALPLPEEKETLLLGAAKA